MKGFMVLILWGSSILLWSQWEQTVYGGIEGERGDDKTEVNTSWEWHLSRHSLNPASAGLYISVVPDSRSEGAALDSLCFTLDTTYVSAGVIRLEGLYDLAESERIPRSSLLTEEGRFILEKRSSLLDRYGAAFHSGRDNLIFHGLNRREYSQAGICWQSSFSSLSISTVCLYSWNECADNSEESAWFEGSDGRTGEPLLHGVAGIRYELSESPVKWRMAGAGQILYSSLLLPGYALYLYGEGKGESWDIRLSWQENKGYMRTTEGKGFDWSRGICWEGEIRVRSVVCRSRGALYQPGCFSVGPGVDPRGIPPLWEERIQIVSPLFSCYWEGEDDSPETGLRSKGGIFGMAEWQGIKGRAGWEVSNRNDSWNRRVSGMISREGRSFLWEGEVKILWDSRRETAPSGRDWRVKAAWEGFPPGTLSLSIGGAGDVSSDSGGSLEGGLAFQSAGF